MSEKTPVSAIESVPRLPGALDVIGYLPGMFIRVVVPSIVIVLLFSLPFGEVIQPDRLILVEVLFITVCTAIFLVFFRWQVSTVHSSETPETRWIEALVLVAVLFVSVFARVYRITSVSTPDAFGTQLSMIDAYFFTLGTLSTAGTGDIVARGQFAKSITIVQMVADLAFIGVVVRVLTTAGRNAVQRRRSPDAPSDFPDAGQPS